MTEPGDITKHTTGTVRNFLNQNKIYFETIGYIAISMASIFISWLQYVISVKQIEVAQLQTSLLDRQNSIADLQSGIAKRQLKIDTLKSMPHFDMSMGRSELDKDGKLDGQSLIISNNGESVSNFTSDQYHVFELKLTTTSKRSVAYLIINDYFAATTTQGQSKGEIKIALGVHNVSNGFPIYRILLEISRKMIDTHLDFLDFDEFTFVTIEYDDLFDEHHKEYYLLDSPGVATKLSDAAGLDMTASLKTGIRKNFSEITKEYIVSLVNDMTDNRRYIKQAPD